jgi:hypothetical protein
MILKFTLITQANPKTNGDDGPLKSSLHRKKTVVAVVVTISLLVAAGVVVGALFALHVLPPNNGVIGAGSTTAGHMILLVVE